MLEILKAKSQISAARSALNAAGLSALEGKAVGFLRRFGLNRGLPVGDRVKSWDVHRSLDFLEARLEKSASVLDLGAYCSEVPVALARMGFTDVHGVDLNPNVRSMPYSDRVRYTVSDFNETPFESGSFDAITAISVIEHGYDPERLFKEVGRLLKPSGYFLASFDYWPDKIDTAGVQFFGMSWLIFSKGEIEAMLEVCERHGLLPVGAVNSEAEERVVHCMGFDYTFGWLALRKE